MKMLYHIALVLPFLINFSMQALANGIRRFPAAIDHTARTGGSG